MDAINRVPTGVMNAAATPFDHSTGAVITEQDDESMTKELIKVHAPVISAGYTVVTGSTEIKRMKKRSFSCDNSTCFCMDSARGRRGRADTWAALLDCPD